MMDPQVTGDATQSHPIHIQLQGFAPCLLVIGPSFGVRRIFDLAVHASVALAARTGFASSVLSFGSLAFRTSVHIPILAHFLATPRSYTF